MAQDNPHHVKHVVSALQSLVALHSGLRQGISDHAAKHDLALDKARKDAEIKVRMDAGIARQHRQV